MLKGMTRVHSLRWKADTNRCLSPDQGVINRIGLQRSGVLLHASEQGSLAGLAFRHSRELLFRLPLYYPSTFLRSLRSRPITALPRYYGRSDSCPPGSSAPPCMNTVSARGQVSLIHDLGLPTSPSPTTHQSLDAAFARYPSARQVSRLYGSRLHLSLAGSPVLAGRIELLIVRIGRSPPAAPHLTSR